jgi:hypothetical protein
MRVVIRSITSAEENDRGFNGEQTVVEVDGIKIGEGIYGGEPEDNARRRDYKWVEPLLKTLSEKLGAEVEIIHEKVETLWE